MRGENMTRKEWEEFFKGTSPYTEDEEEDYDDDDCNEEFE